jgi:hypothetical protein
VNYAEPGVPDHGQLALHVAVSAIAVYVLGHGIEGAVQRWPLPQAG